MYFLIMTFHDIWLIKPQLETGPITKRTDSLFIFHLFIFRERRRERERKRERNITYLPLTCSSTKDLTHNSGMCPDWEPNWQPLSTQASIQFTETHQPAWENRYLMDLCTLPWKQYSLIKSCQILEGLGREIIVNASILLRREWFTSCSREKTSFLISGKQKDLKLAIF